MYISYRRFCIIFVITLGICNSAFSLEKEFFVGNKKFFTELFKENLVKMNECFLKSDNKLLCKKMYVNLARNEKNMTQKKICSHIGIISNVKDGKRVCEKMYEEKRINDYELFLYKYIGYFYDAKLYKKMIPSMFSKHKEVTYSKYYLGGSEKSFSKIIFSVYYPMHESEITPDGESEYVEKPPLYSFTRVIMYLPIERKFLTLDDFVKFKHEIIVNFQYIGPDSGVPSYDLL